MTVSKRTLVGSVSLATALIVLFTLTFLPTSFVVQQPGPVYNTIGTAQTPDGDELPLIEVHDAETYDTSGSLDLTTVQVLGNRQRTPSWVELAVAWFDVSKAVIPLDAVYPQGITVEQREAQNAALMVDSQAEATAAALAALGHDIDGETEIRVVEVPEGTPADGVFEPDDVILSADGRRIDDVEQLRQAIAARDGEAIAITYRRGGDERTVDLAPVRAEVDGEASWAIGVVLSAVTRYEFPVDITIQLDDVGGPSAGLMFALGIVDVLTEEDLTGGAHIAGTGTIDGHGTVGTIGGIRQKLHGARDAGAEWFLAPAGNCDEVVGHIPAGLRVAAVSTLDEALEAVEAIADDQTSDVPGCGGR